MVMTDGRPGLRGIGLFARLGAADDDTNPISWAVSGGIGGRGMIPARDNDLFGVAYFYNSLAVTPAINITFDAQWVQGSGPLVESAWLFGGRFVVSF